MTRVSEKVDHVAQAIFDVCHPELKGESMDMLALVNGGGEVRLGSDIYRAAARAAIEMMYEPTEAMMSFRPARVIDAGVALSPGEVRAWYQAIIVAALVPAPTFQESRQANKQKESLS